MQRALPAVALLLVLAGCLHIDPIEVNVNVNVKLDKALNDFFGDLDKQATSTAPVQK